VTADGLHENVGKRLERLGHVQLPVGSERLGPVLLDAPPAHGELGIEGCVVRDMVGPGEAVAAALAVEQNPHAHCGPRAQDDDAGAQPHLGGADEVYGTQRHVVTSSSVVITLRS
jgi:hypothetical protein